MSHFQAELCDYPDQAAASYILPGLREGFHIGFEALSVSLCSASANMYSALVHPSVIDAYLGTDVSCGRVAGPFATLPFPDLHISRFGVIPKNNQPGQWRLIFDLSSLEGHSVNDGIPKPLLSVQYVTVDSFIDGIMARGRGTLMAKFDVVSAYRNVAIHSQDRSLLGMKWSIAYMVEWILTLNYGVDFLCHYLDDFMTLGPPASLVCHYNL